MGGSNFNARVVQITLLKLRGLSNIKEKFSLVDYSETYYRVICKARVPSRRGGKFVQLDDDETEYVVLSPEGLSIFHANIVERFCVLNDIKGHYNAQFNYFTIDYSEIEIVGGGFWEIDETKKLLYLFGLSQAYGQFRLTNLKEKLLGFCDMANYEIHFHQPPSL